jgi:hypothetical protein
MTEKKIQDYLHLYGIDCPVMTPDGIGSILVIYPNVVEVCLNVIKYKQVMKGRKGGGEMHYKYFYPDIKLILRPLSDITEDEKLEFIELCGIEPEDIDCLIKSRDDFFPEPETSYGTAHLTNIAQWTVGVKYLLSKKFDLFQLIESGLALDKTKHPCPHSK